MRVFFSKLVKIASQFYIFLSIFTPFGFILPFSKKNPTKVLQYALLRSSLRDNFIMPPEKIDVN